MAPPFVGRVLASSNVAGRGVVAVVSVEAGAVAIGDHVNVSGRPAVVSALEAFAQDEEERAEGKPPQLGLLLTGIELADVPRGAEVRAAR